MRLQEVYSIYKKASSIGFSLLDQSIIVDQRTKIFPNNEYESLDSCLKLWTMRAQQTVLIPNFHEHFFIRFEQMYKRLKHNFFHMPPSCKSRRNNFFFRC